MVDEFYIILIVALLPITSGLLVVQDNPYHALVIRGIVGAIAALVYALFGAADVALTEALVGTMLAITLYAVAARSSMCMKLGVLDRQVLDRQVKHSPEAALASELTDTLLPPLRRRLDLHHLRLELIPYPNTAALETALVNRDVHVIASNTPLAFDIPETNPPETNPPETNPHEASPSEGSTPGVASHHLYTRVPQLQQILTTDQLTPSCRVKWLDLAAWQSQQTALRSNPLDRKGQEDNIPRQEDHA